MTFEDRVGALKSFRFTPRQARFVATVALNGGYCLRRQYMEFSGIKYGRNVRDFLDGLVISRLAERSTFRTDRGHVYHVYAKSIYRALGQENNRNRRRVSLALIARRLMALDVVLMDPTMEWFATEDDKVALFTTRYGVPLEALPRRRYESQDPLQEAATRYFVHKLPIGIRLGDVCFVYLAGDLSDVAFEHFLMDHAGLFARLPSWVVAVVRPPHGPDCNRWQEIFNRFRGRARIREPVSPEDLRWFFEIRQLLDNNRMEFISIDSDGPRFRGLRAKLMTPQYEQLYSEWLRRGPAALAGHYSPIDALTAGLSTNRGGLIVRTLKHDYSQFGEPAGCC